MLLTLNWVLNIMSLEYEVYEEPFIGFFNSMTTNCILIFICYTPCDCWSLHGYCSLLVDEICCLRNCIRFNMFDNQEFFVGSLIVHFIICLVVCFFYDDMFYLFLPEFVLVIFLLFHHYSLCLGWIYLFNGSSVPNLYTIRGSARFHSQ